MDDERLNKLIDDFYLITLLFRKSLLQYKRILKHKKIAPLNYWVLEIMKKRGAIPMSEIGRKVCISKSNMTSLIDKLVEEGLVERNLIKMIEE